MSDKLKENYLALRKVRQEFWELKIGHNVEVLGMNPKAHELTAMRIRYEMSKLDSMYEQLLAEIKDSGGGDGK